MINSNIRKKRAKMFGKIKHVYFVGIGGAGMCGIAEILLSLGFNVSGSDKNLTDTTDYLTKAGATVYKGHFSENLKSLK